MWNSIVGYLIGYEATKAHVKMQKDPATIVTSIVDGSSPHPKKEMEGAYMKMSVHEWIIACQNVTGKGLLHNNIIMHSHILMPSHLCTTEESQVQDLRFFRLDLR